MASASLEKAIALIKQFEGFNPNAYPDPRTGGKPITIGWGSTRNASGGEWRMGDRITETEAHSLLLHQLQVYYLPPLSRIPCWQRLNDNQQAALISFAYNLGANFYGGEGFDTITRCLREGNLGQIEPALLLYCNPGTNVEQGLRRRRQAEAKLFLTVDNSDMVTTLTPSPAIFRIIRPTWLKRAPQSAKDLPLSSKVELPVDAYLKATSFTPVGKHYKVVVESQSILCEQQGKAMKIAIEPGEWYLYGSPLTTDPHVEVFLSTPSLPVVPQPQSVEPFATFNMPLPAQSQRALVTGTLDLVGTSEPHSFTCTSGQPGYQYQGSTHLKGKAPLPSCKEVAIVAYWILTEELERFQTKGIEGYAFHIFPDPVNIRGVMRGEFMVHNDTNRAVFPGSSGCIVFLFDNGWNVWRECMKEFRARGIEKIPLKVVHE
jgi:GH24 family phage-related lysozyme (muramidase)